ncbi:MaoC/PaaZ C-terminal domain-containing protein [Nocardia sp. NPDC057455]|uniref:MaoC/PaaZ C-terminal domain-containing protein n=1 Tax=Nocardia sp. NPDC057455 TaxID=3346138 RepID=UPI00366AF604
MAMPILRDTAIGVTVPEQEFRWTDRDVRRYHDAVGWSGADGTVLPTFAMTAPGVFGVASPEFYRPQPPEVRFPGVRLELGTLLHREQEIRVHRPVPVAGAAISRSEIAEVEDLGTAAVLVQRSTLVGTDGVALVTGCSRIYARGAGGFGGPPDSSIAVAMPERAADAVSDTPTSPWQAVRYQRCGRGTSMRGNVHTDAAFAAAAGFPMPILQGVCTYAIACAAVLASALGADARRVRRFSARFLGVVFPGETLRTRTWVDDEVCVFSTSVVARPGKPVLSGTLAFT